MNIFWNGRIGILRMFVEIDKKWSPAHIDNMAFGLQYFVGSRNNLKTELMDSNIWRYANGWLWQRRFRRDCVLGLRGPDWADELTIGIDRYVAAGSWSGLGPRTMIDNSDRPVVIVSIIRPGRSILKSRSRHANEIISENILLLVAGFASFGFFAFNLHFLGIFRPLWPDRRPSGSLLLLLDVAWALADWAMIVGAGCSSGEVILRVNEV